MRGQRDGHGCALCAVGGCRHTHINDHEAYTNESDPNFLHRGLAEYLVLTDNGHLMGI